MSTNPVSFRFPFESQISDMPSHHQEVIRTTWNAITDLQTAIPLLKSSIDTKVSKTTTSSSTSSSASSSSGSSGSSSTPATTLYVTSAIAAAVTGVKASIKSTFPGAVNLQTGVTSYSTQQSDYGAMIVFDDASPIAVSLSVLNSLPSISLPFYCLIFNDGTGTITCTPISGLVNGNANVQIPGGGLGIIYFSGTNFYASVVSVAGSGVTSLDGITGAITLVAGSGISITNGSPSAQDITIATSGGGGTYLKGSCTINCSATSGTFFGTATIAGAAISMGALMLVPADDIIGSTIAFVQGNLTASVSGANTVQCAVTIAGFASPPGSVTFPVIVFV